MALSRHELADRFIDFAVGIGLLVDELPDTRLGRHIASQIIRSGTAAAPNYAEACAAESRRDFAHKLQIALKEMRETEVWLQIILRASLINGGRLDQFIDECGQLCRILGKSVVTAKRNSR